MREPLVVKIRPEFVERLARRANSVHWQRDLFDAQLPQALEELDLTHADEPARAFAAALGGIYDGVARLAALEGHRIDLERRHPWSAGQAPAWSWLVPLIVVAALVQLFGSFVIGLAVGALGFGFVALVGLVFLGWTQAQRRRALADVKRLQDEQRRALAKMALDTLGKPLDVVLGERRYVVEPCEVEAAAP